MLMPGQARQNSKYFKDKKVADASKEMGGKLDEEIFDEVDAFDFVLNEAPKAHDYDHDHYQDTVCEHHEEHEMHDDVQPNYVVDSHANYVSDSNMIPYDQYAKIQRSASFDNSLTAELATYKEQVDCMKDGPDLIKMKKEALQKAEHRLKTNQKRFYGGTLKGKGFETNQECISRRSIIFKQLKETFFEGIQKALTKEIKEMKDIFEELEAEVDQNIVERKHDEIEWKNFLIAHDTLIADCLSKEVFYVATNSELNVSRFNEMHVANTIVEARCLELEAELSNLQDKI
ncbi:hypothetical protein Tco_1105429 [Tanacetum coccineum]